MSQEISAEELALMPSREAGVLTQYAIYDHPADHPDYFVVRPWDIKDGECVARKVAGLFRDLATARAWCEQLGLYCLGRWSEDVSWLVEVWT